MPTYDFKCAKCGATITKALSIHAKEFRATCVCGEEMVKTFTPPVVTFRGTGWGRDR